MILQFTVAIRSLNNVEGWRKRSLNILGEDVPCVLVGTKADLGRMPEENWSFICESNKFHDWFQTSAKTGEGVKEAFEVTKYNKMGNTSIISAPLKAQKVQSLLKCWVKCGFQKVQENFTALKQKPGGVL